MENERIDLNLLRTFIAVVEQGSLSAAAARLDVPVSTVSRAITRLEEDLGAQLLVRTTRRLSQTTAGRALYQRVGPLLASLGEELERLASDTEGPVGDLRITAPVEFGTHYLAEAVGNFLTRYPGVKLHMHLTNDVIDLVKDEIDLAIRFASASLKDSSLLASKLADLASGVYASPAYLARKGTPRTPRDLHDHEWVVFSRITGPLSFGHGRARVEVTPTGRIASSEILFVRELVREGAGIGFLPEFLALDDQAKGTLVRVVPQASIRMGAIWLMRPAARHVPAAVAAFRDFITAYMQTRPLVPAP